VRSLFRIRGGKKDIVNYDGQQHLQNCSCITCPEKAVIPCVKNTSIRKFPDTIDITVLYNKVLSYQDECE